MAAIPCPCGSKLRYSQCCRPFHVEGKEAETAEKLMRSRFSAFALREVEYLWKTLDAEHPERRRAHDEVCRELRVACQKYKYVRLHVESVQEASPHETAQVTFFAEVFESGKNRSFRETSLFRHDGVGWRYWRPS